MTKGRENELRKSDGMKKGQGEERWRMKMEEGLGGTRTIQELAPTTANPLLPTGGAHWGKRAPSRGEKTPYDGERPCM